MPDVIQLVTIENFGEVVKKARKAKGLTQRDLEARTGTTLYYVSRLEAGEAKWNHDTIIKFSQALGLVIRIAVGMSEEDFNRFRTVS